MDEADLESIFHPNLPNFSIFPTTDVSCHLDGNGTQMADAEAAHLSSPQSASATKAPHLAISHGQVFAIDDLMGIAAPSQVISDSSNAVSQATANDAVLSFSKDSCDSVDKAHASLIRAAQMGALPVLCGLNESTFSAALVRRPLLAARLALMHRFHQGVQTVLQVEACANAALPALKTAEAAAAAADFTVEAPGRRGAQAVANAAASTAKRAAAHTKSAWLKARRSLQECDKNINKRDEAIVQELESIIKEAEAKNPRGPTTHAARRALQEHFSRGAQQNRTLLSIETALEVKLLAWREVEQYPAQTKQLLALLPLHDVCPHPAAAPATVSKARAETNEMRNGMLPPRLPNFKEKLSESLAGSNGHLNPMIYSLDDHDDEEDIELGSTEHLSLCVENDTDLDAVGWSGPGLAHESNFDDEVHTVTTRFEKRLAASRNQPDKKGRTRPLSSALK